MIDSNQNEFAGATPTSKPLASWDWLKERVPTSRLEDLDHWLDEQLVELEGSYEHWMTSKSIKLALQSELRDSRA